MSKELVVSVTKKDLEIQTFRSGGKGGQHQNTTDSGVRIIHKESGAVGESRTERSQSQNKKLALNRLASSKEFKLWVQKKAFEVDCSERELQEKVDFQMQDKFLKVEIRKDKKWIEE